MRASENRQYAYDRPLSAPNELPCHAKCVVGRAHANLAARRVRLDESVVNGSLQDEIEYRIECDMASDMRV